jgi:hypothetical protein
MQVSCSYLPPQVGSQMRMAYQGVSGIVFGYEDYPITQAMVDNIPYASMRMKIGKGGAGFLILKEKNANINSWVSSDEITFNIKHGRIVETYGLFNDLNYYYGSDKDLSFSSLLKKNIPLKKSIRTISLSNPEVRGLIIEVSTEVKGLERVTILNKSYDLILIEETIINSYIKWVSVNQYWVDPSDGFVWKSNQKIAPNIPLIKIEILKKPA